jgi:hypothetical protein
MKAILNNREITLFKGARLSDLVLAYSRKGHKMLLSGQLIVCDRFGNQTESDGPVTEGQVFVLKRNR